ncbi:MAG: DUF817 domain-containing protein [Crocinitomicaceae bacterium]|nr:DUF817 domain-containing protein [Crocinitomicaceae bacterium]
MKRVHNHIIQALVVDSNQSRLTSGVTELVAFTYKNAISCIFPVFIFAMLAVSRMVDQSFIPRYDFLLIVCVLAQIVLFLTGIESKREVAVIFIFHGLGILLELYKVNVGSWSYPEEAFTKFAGVPLYSGFMYSSVASYICRAWDNFDLKIVHWPHSVLAIAVGAIIYINFFTNAFMADLRWYIIPVLFIVFWRTKVEFNPNGIVRRMPMLLSFVLIGFFIWLAENIATFLGAWKYAYQHEGWKLVDASKLTSWSLLVIVSVIIVGQLKRLRRGIVD